MDEIISLLANCKSNLNEPKWERCKRPVFSVQLENKVLKDKFICQGPYGYFCGTAAVVQDLLQKDPLLFTKVAIDLYEEGCTNRTSKTAQGRTICIPRIQSSLLTKDPFNEANRQFLTSEHGEGGAMRTWDWIDWIMLSSFRSHVATRILGIRLFSIREPRPGNGVLAILKNALHEGTTVRQVFNLLATSGFMIDEADARSFIRSRGRDSLSRAFTLRRLAQNQRSVLLFVNSDVLERAQKETIHVKKLGERVGTHWISLAPSTSGANGLAVSDRLSFEYSDYGSTKTFTGNLSDFLSGYYGFVSFY